MLLVLAWSSMAALHAGGHECDEDMLAGYWRALRAKGVRTAEAEMSKVNNIRGIAEGGTDELEFMEEVALVRDALRQGLRGQGHPPLMHVCQTGFNAGVSALAFLCSTPSTVTVHSCDLGEHDYVVVAQGILEHDYNYAERHRLVLGSSLETLPAAVQQDKLRCDFVFVDGGHTFNIASNDIVMFGRMSRPGARFVVENCNVFGRVSGWGGQHPVNMAYKNAVGSGNITHVKQVSTGGCHEKAQGHTCRELCVGEWQGNNGAEEGQTRGGQHVPR